MLITIKCENKDCENYEKEIERIIASKDVNNQVCSVCNKKVVRVWKSSAIKTSDGTKY